MNYNLVVLIKLNLEDVLCYSQVCFPLKEYRHKFERYFKLNSEPSKRASLLKDFAWGPGKV